MTCNPKWKEITDALLPGQTASDRPDLVVRVFKMKVDELRKDLFSNDVFGKSIAHVMVIEFQKRGLPHTHILVILSKDFKILSVDQIDPIISAEIPNPETQPRLHELVVKHMIHGPCSSESNRPCIVNHKCTKGYPRPFSNATKLNENGYPSYRRRSPQEEGGFTGTLRNGTTVDNRWVVPYNPFLLLKYNCHLNMEMCASITSVKYLYKYIYKGSDRATIEIGTSTETEIDTLNSNSKDEIKQYLDGRYISPPEAMWRIYSFPLQWRSPNVVSLSVHLQDEQMVYFARTEDEQEQKEILEKTQNTTLMGWFNLNREEHENPPTYTTKATELYYHEIPKYYTLNHKKQWRRRKNMQSNTAVGRLNMVNPAQGEQYYLRLLLLHVKCATTFADIRTFKNSQHETYKECCIARGLLEDDSEWFRTLTEAVDFGTPRQMRNLFATILIHGDTSNPLKLWNEFKDHMSEDILFASEEKTFTEEIYNEALLEISDLVTMQNTTLEHFGIKTPQRSRRYKICNEVRQELNYDVEQYEQMNETNIASMNAEQKNVYDEIVNSVYGDDDTTNKLFFLDAPGGTGKTFLCNTLLALIRSKKDVH